jgi:CRP-like cAMP-binding protein
VIDPTMSLPQSSPEKGDTTPPEFLQSVPSGGRNKVEITVNLRKIPLFAQLTDAEMKGVQENLRFRFFEKRATVIQQGTPNGGIVFLLSGQLQLVRLTEDGRAISLDLIPEGGFFGEISLLNEQPYAASAIALSRVLVAILPPAQALHLFAHSPSVANYLLRHMARQLQRDAEFKALLGITNTSRRIVNFLWLIKKETPTKQLVVENLPTHQDIANTINTSRETVTRLLILLTQKGIIQRDAHRLIILDPEALTRMALE